MTPLTPSCIHHVLDGNIHEFILTEATRLAVDELFDTAEQVMADAYAKQDTSVITGCFLLDSRVGILPLNYAFARAKLMTQKFPANASSRTACLFPASSLTKTVGFFLRSVAPVRIYGPDERDKALAWLREVSASASRR